MVFLRKEGKKEERDIMTTTKDRERERERDREKGDPKRIWACSSECPDWIFVYPSDAWERRRVEGKEDRGGERGHQETDTRLGWSSYVQYSYAPSFLAAWNKQGHDHNNESVSGRDRQTQQTD